MVRRPLTLAPREGTVAIVDDGPREGTIQQRDLGLFVGGKWTRASFTPTHWTLDERTKKKSGRKGR